MPCKFLITRFNSISQMGPPSLPKGIYLCSLKLENEQQRFAIHQVLSEKKVEGRYVTDNCPVASSCNWEDCPYYVKI